MKEKIDKICKSLLNAELGNSKLTGEILNYRGQSSYKIRHYLNNLMELPDINYLEIGTLYGSTFISSLYKNKLNAAYALDLNFTLEFNNITEKLDLKFTKFEGDCFVFDLSKINHKINVYLFDGPHSYDDQKAALEYFYPILDDTFIFLCDDWRMDDTTVRKDHYRFVEEGTRAAIKKLNLKTIFEDERDGYANDMYGWWNGYYTALFQK